MFKLIAKNVHSKYMHVSPSTRSISVSNTPKVGTVVGIHSLEPLQRRGHGGFDAIGSDQEHPELSLEQLMSYDEMAMSALMSVGGPTQFVNRGDRYNRGRVDEDGTFVAHGVYIGCVGARFERPEKMEWQHMIVSKDQNVAGKGYGPPDAANYRASPMLQAWAKLYEVKYFPLYSEVVEQMESDSDQSRFHRVQSHDYFLDRQVGDSIT